MHVWLRLTCTCLAVLCCPLGTGLHGAHAELLGPAQQDPGHCKQATETAERLSESMRALQKSLHWTAEQLAHLKQHVNMTSREVADVIASNGSTSVLIPRIIHQSWKNKELPPKFQLWHQSWRTLNPGWHYKLWTDDDNHQLMITHFPWFNDTYVNFPHHIMKADSARYMYMYMYGGVYADLDMECLRPMEDLFADLLGGQRAAVAQMGTNPSVSNSLPNAFLVSEPQHAFWLACLHDIMAARRNDRLDQHPVVITGPAMLKRVLENFWYPLKLPGFTILAPGIIYPYDWNQHTPEEQQKCHSAGRADFNATGCKQLFPDAYTITYWDYTWGR